MSKHHINPNTGRPNICNPEKTGICKYAVDGENPPHYDTREEAKAAYEKTGKAEFGATATLSKSGSAKKQYFIYVDCRGRNLYSATQEDIDAAENDEDIFGNPVGFGYCDSCHDMDQQIGTMMSVKPPTREQMEAALANK